MPKPSDEAFLALGREIEKAAAAGDADALSDAVEEFELAAVQRCPPARTAETVLSALKKGRHFTKLCRIADTCLDCGLDTPFVRIQYAQGMIELGHLHQALSHLNRLRGELGSDAAKKRELSEVMGLLGRAHKQRFVRFGKERERAALALAESIRLYRGAYDLDPAWHGANLVALVNRAEREGISPGERLRSEDVATRLLKDIRGLPGSKQTFWTAAAMGEASLALKDWPTAGQCYGQFAQNADAFALAGAARNLREIWGVEPGGGDPSAGILMALEARTMSVGNGQVGYAPEDLPRVAESLTQSIAEPAAHLEAILGDNRQVDLQTLLALIEAASAVCQVVNRYRYAARRKSGGTGFVVDGGRFKEKWNGKPVLVTNNHVLSRYGDPPSVKRSDALAVFHYWSRTAGEKTFQVKSLELESPRDALDVTLALLDDPDGTLDVSRNWLRPNTQEDVLGRAEARPPGKVYLVGHPDGRGLEFSLSDNTLIDHDLMDVDADRPYRRIHYKAPTEKGMSGSPVLCENGLQVIGLHRAGGRVAPLHPSNEGGEYRANEAVWIESIRRKAAEA